MSRFAVVAAPVVWHDDAAPFAFVEHDANAYTLRIVAAGIDIYVDMDGDDVRIAQVDTEAEALEVIAHHAYQMIEVD